MGAQGGRPRGTAPLLHQPALSQPVRLAASATAAALLCLLAVGQLPSQFEVALSFPAVGWGWGWGGGVPGDTPPRKSEDTAGLGSVDGYGERVDVGRWRACQRLEYTPLAGAAFTHLVALAEEAGAVEARDLVLGRDWPDHLHTRPVLLAWDELGRGHRGEAGPQGRGRGRRTERETKGQVYLLL